MLRLLEEAPIGKACCTSAFVPTLTRRRAKIVGLSYRLARGGGNLAQLLKGAENGRFSFLGMVGDTML